MVMRFPAKKNAGCSKAPRDFPRRKDGILCPRRVVLGLPSPSHRVCGRTDVRMYGRTDDHVTITSQPKFLGLIGYYVSLAMELRCRALPAGSAIILIIYGIASQTRSCFLRASFFARFNWQYWGVLLPRKIKQCLLVWSLKFKKLNVHCTTFDTW